MLICGNNLIGCDLRNICVLLLIVFFVGSGRCYALTALFQNVNVKVKTITFIHCPWFKPSIKSSTFISLCK